MTRSTGAAQPGEGRRRQQVALALAAFLVGGLLAELGLRQVGVRPVAVNPDQQSLWVHHPQLGWTSRPDYDGVLDNGFSRVHVHTNSLGLRGPERSLARPAHGRRLLVVGDSLAWGFGVEDEATFAARVERAVPGVEVINGGVSGYSTDQALLWLQLQGLRFQPDEVVYVLAGNDDIMNHMQVAYWIYYKPSFRLGAHGELQLRGVPVPRPGVGERLRHVLRSHSAIAKAIEVAWSGHEAPFVYLADGYPDPRDPHRLTVALVSAMHRLAGSVGASFVVLADSQFWFSPEGSYDRLLRELRRAGHDVLDIDSSPGWSPETMRIPGDGHWNERGHDFIARQLVRRLH